MIKCTTSVLSTKDFHQEEHLSDIFSIADNMRFYHKVRDIVHPHCPQSWYLVYILPIKKIDF